jgi:hypothetical protein
MLGDHQSLADLVLVRELLDELHLHEAQIWWGEAYPA